MKIYQDDSRSIHDLRRGEWLRSTCPMPRKSKESVVEHISDEHYIESIDSHVVAAKRGVNVVRIYFFQTREFFEQKIVKEHLLKLKENNIDILIKIFDEIVQLDNEIDFLIFGKTKVSVGAIDYASGKVSSAIVHYDPKTIEIYTDIYDKMARTAERVGQPTG